MSVITGVCDNCGKKGILYEHHIVPKCNGGTNRATNIARLCDKCHSKVHNQDFTNIHKLQMIGIRKYLKKHKKWPGRQKKKIPSNFKQVYSEWKADNITAMRAMELTHLAKSTFYRMVKTYEKDRMMIRAS